MIFFNLPNPSSHTRPWIHSASDRNEYQKQKNNVSGGKVQPNFMADSLIVIREPTV
jgi:hypothetical protein